METARDGFHLFKVKSCTDWFRVGVGVVLTVIVCVCVCVGKLKLDKSIVMVTNVLKVIIMNVQHWHIQKG